MANEKTWLPKLLKLAQMVCAYIRRYEAQIKKHVSEETWTLIDAACTALDLVIAALIDVLPPEV